MEFLQPGPYGPADQRHVQKNGWGALQDSLPRCCGSAHKTCMAWWSSHIASLYGHALLAANGTRFRDKIHGIVWHIDIAHRHCVCRHVSMMMVTSASLIISVRAVFVVSSSRPLCERQVFSYCPHLGFQNRYTEQVVGCVLTEGGSMPGLHGIYSCVQ